jgi:hypothetical protein
MKGILLFFISLLLSTQAYAMPKQVIIMRHAEKPSVGPYLSEVGEQRAQALVDYLREKPKWLQYGLPTALFAQRPDDVHHSLRSIQTLEPLAQALSLAIDEDYTRDEYPKMIEKIKRNAAYDDKVVLICWSHDALPKMAKKFGAEHAPREWLSDVYDQLWVITFAHREVQFAVKTFPGS